MLFGRDLVPKLCTALGLQKPDVLLWRRVGAGCGRLLFADAETTVHAVGNSLQLITTASGKRVRCYEAMLCSKSWNAHIHTARIGFSCLWCLTPPCKSRLESRAIRTSQHF